MPSFHFHRTFLNWKKLLLQIEAHLFSTFSSQLSSENCLDFFFNFDFPNFKFTIVPFGETKNLYYHAYMEILMILFQPNFSLLFPETVHQNLTSSHIEVSIKKKKNDEN